MIGQSIFRLGAGVIVATMIGTCATTEMRVSPAAREINAHFQREAEAGRFSGVVLIARGDDIVLERGYGYADFENRTPMRAESILRIGSLTKPVTASAVLVAAQSGRLSLTDEICAALPSCPRAWRGVTIRHLLTHTSGIRDHFGDLQAVPVEQTATELARALAAIDPAESLASAPGTEYAYSNFNYVLLGAALERAYGAPWEAVLRQTVLDPTGARDVAYDDVWALTPRRAHGYDRRDDGSVRNIEYDDHAAYAAGGLRSSVHDLFVWSRGVFTGRLFGQALLREALTPAQERYGYGWQMRQFFGRDVQNHNGGIDGFASHIVHYAADDITIIVLSNIEADAAVLPACDAAAIWFGARAAGADTHALTPQQRCGIG
jgi:CubicO group peptidase (beta-lactamase class C family)